MTAPTAIATTPLSRVATADPAGVSADTTNGNSFRNTGHTVIRVVNSDSGASHTVTFVTPGQVDGLDIADDGPTTIAESAVAWFSGYDVPTFGAVAKIVSSHADLKITVFEG